MAQKMRSVYDNVLFLNAGDAVMGTVFYTIFEGTADRNMMNYNAMTSGNHEFDKGIDGVDVIVGGYSHTELLSGITRALFSLFKMNRY